MAFEYLGIITYPIALITILLTWGIVKLLKKNIKDKKKYKKYARIIYGVALYIVIASLIPDAAVLSYILLLTVALIIGVIIFLKRILGLFKNP